MAQFGSRTRLLGRLAVAFLITSSLTGAALTLVQSAHAYRTFPANQEEDAFWKAGYAYCDAEKLGQLYGMNTYDAKVFAGEKILNGMRNLVDQEIDEALDHGYRCPNGFNYDDSVKLGELWGMTHGAVRLKP